MNANLGWYPNGVSLYDVSPGVYSTNGGAIPNGLEALNPYGTLLIMKGNIAWHVERTTGTAYVGKIQVTYLYVDKK